MSELLVPVSSSRHKDSLIFSTQIFSFLDGTVCLIDTALNDKIFVDVYRHKEGMLTEAPLDRDEMILEEEPQRSEVDFSRRMALEAAERLQEMAGVSLLRTVERYSISNAPQ
jgi:hypothetical protein